MCFAPSREGVSRHQRPCRRSLATRACALTSCARSSEYHDLVLGEVVLAELRRVLATKLKLPLIASQRLRRFAPFPVTPKPSNPSELPIRDAADRWILATAVAGNADVLVTGDRDLLDVALRDSPLRILEPRAFWELLRTESTD
ncbi:MAG: putative toxin-antitoxin system toxin component, PIN family [Gemmatimonadaceae bacterium]